MKVPLKQQQAWCLRSQIALGLLLALAGGLFYFAGYRPMELETENLDRTLAERRRQLSDGSERLKVLPAVEAEVRQLRARLDGQKKLPQETELAQFIRDLTRLTQNQSLSRFQYKPDATQRNRFFSQLPIQLGFEGDFVKVFQFLTEVEGLERLIRIRTLTLQARPENPGTVQAEVTMNIYFSPQE